MGNFSSPTQTPIHASEYLQSLQDDWKGLKQNDSPVMAFSNKVLKVGVQLRKSDKSCLKAFRYGLDDCIKFDVWLMNPANFNSTVGVALQHEMKHNKGKLKDASKSSTTLQNQSTSNSQNQAGKSSCKNSNGSTSSTPKHRMHRPMPIRIAKAKLRSLPH